MLAIVCCAFSCPHLRHCRHCSSILPWHAWFLHPSLCMLGASLEARYTYGRRQNGKALSLGVLTDNSLPCVLCGKLEFDVRAFRGSKLPRRELERLDEIDLPQSGKALPTVPGMVQLRKYLHVDVVCIYPPDTFLPPNFTRVSGLYFRYRVRLQGTLVLHSKASFPFMHT